MPTWRMKSLSSHWHCLILKLMGDKSEIHLNEFLMTDENSMEHGVDIM